MSANPALAQFKKYLKALTKSTVVRNIFGLATATALSQLVVLGAAPVITRLYEPRVFGVFSTYISLLAIAGSFSGLRFDAAIPVPRSKKIAKALSILAIGSMFLVSLVFALGAVCVTFCFPKLSNHLDLSILLAGACAVFSWGFFRVLQQWVVRERKYKLLRGAVLVQTSLQITIQVVLGAINPVPICLVASDAIKAISGIAFLNLQHVPMPWSIRNGDVKTLCVAAVRYHKFAMYSSAAAILNATANWFLPIFMAANYDFKAAGLVGVCQRIVGAPTSLIGGSVAKIYTGELAIALRESPADARRLFQKTAVVLAVFGVLLVAGIGLPGFFLAGAIFGGEWRGLGPYVLVLSIVYAAKMVAFPLGSTLDIYRSQDQHLIREIVRVAAVVGGVAISLVRSLPAIETVVLVAVCQTVGHIFAVLSSYRVVQQRLK